MSLLREKFAFNHLPLVLVTGQCHRHHLLRCLYRGDFFSVKVLGPLCGTVD